MFSVFGMNFLLAVLFFVLSLLTTINAQLRIQLSREEIQSSCNIFRWPWEKDTRTSKSQIVTSNKNVYYYGYLKIGTPGDVVRVVFDTGSPSLWVYSGSGLSSWLCLSCWLHKSYHHSYSSTYVPVGRSVEMDYMHGHMTGYVSKDFLTVGNLRSMVTLVEATNTPIWKSIKYKYDGIMGLSPCAGEQCPVYKDFPPSALSTIMSQLPEPIFSLYLDDGYGEILFGGKNSSLYKEETLVMHNTSDPYMWSIRIESIWVGDKMVLIYPNGVNAYVDSSTTNIVGPQWDTAPLHHAMGVQPDLKVDCEKTIQFPPITFVIGGVNYTLTWDQYTSMTRTFFGGKQCQHGIEGRDSGFWILGSMFLTSFYTIFEIDGIKTSRIGFADLKI